MHNRVFAERLNHELDAIGVPQPLHEREEAFAKMLHIPRFKASALLEGQLTPNQALAQRIAEELEVNPQWLIGKSADRRN